MHYVYLLQNNKGSLYIGYSSDLRRRLKEHLENKVYTTKRLQCTKLIYYEAYTTKEAAQEREKKLKQFGSSYKGLIKRIHIGA